MKKLRVKKPKPIKPPKPIKIPKPKVPKLKKSPQTRAKNRRSKNKKDAASATANNDQTKSNDQEVSSTPSTDQQTSTCQTIQTNIQTEPSTSHEVLNQNSESQLSVKKGPKRNTKNPTTTSTEIQNSPNSTPKNSKKIRHTLGESSADAASDKSKRKRVYTKKLNQLIALREQEVATTSSENVVLESGGELLERREPNKKKPELGRGLTLNEHLKVQTNSELRSFLIENLKYVGQIENRMPTRSEILIDLRLAEPIGKQT